MRCESSPLTVIRHIWDLEPFPAVSLVRPELYPEPFGTGGEGDGTLVSLTRLVGGHGIGKSCNRRIFIYAKRDLWLQLHCNKKKKLVFAVIGL